MAILSASEKVRTYAASYLKNNSARLKSIKDPEAHVMRLTCESMGLRLPEEYTCDLNALSLTDEKLAKFKFVDVREGDSILSKDILPLLQQRQPHIVEVGEEIPLRSTDKIVGVRKLTMVPDFKKGDIPSAIAFFNKCHSEIPKRAWHDEDYNHRERKTFTTPLGNKLFFFVYTPTDGSFVTIGMAYGIPDNKHVIIGDNWYFNAKWDISSK